MTRTVPQLRLGDTCLSLKISDCVFLEGHGTVPDYPCLGQPAAPTPAGLGLLLLYSMTD